MFLRAKGKRRKARRIQTNDHKERFMTELPLQGMLASAIPFKRSHILSPSEIKSLYGSITRSAVISFSYVTLLIYAPIFAALTIVLRRDARYVWRREAFPAGCEPPKSAYEQPGKSPTGFLVCRESPLALAWQSCEPYL